MPLKLLENRQGFQLGSIPWWALSNASGTAIDAAGESVAAIGRVYLEGGAGTKTISPTAGKIHWVSHGPNVFANAGTTLRIGIQDVSAALEDGTHDVYAELVGGTDAIANSTLFSTPMESGTKDITHGDLIAVVFELTARAGADSVVIARAAGSAPIASNYPFSTADTGSGPARVNALLPVILEFDDGTIGWLVGTPLYNFVAPVTVTFGSGSTPDEYAAIVRFPWRVSVSGWATMIGSIATTDDFEMIVYTDPLGGTPVAARTVAVDPDEAGGAVGVAQYWCHHAPLIIPANTWVGFAVRPTTTNTIQIQHASFLTSGNKRLKRALPFGESARLAARSDQTGAFAETQDYHLPFLWLMIDKLENGARTSFQLGV